MHYHSQFWTQLVLLILHTIYSPVQPLMPHLLKLGLLKLKGFFFYARSRSEIALCALPAAGNAAFPVHSKSFSRSTLQKKKKKKADVYHKRKVLVCSVRNCVHPLMISAVDWAINIKCHSIEIINVYCFSTTLKYQENASIKILQSCKTPSISPEYIKVDKSVFMIKNVHIYVTIVQTLTLLGQALVKTQQHAQSEKIDCSPLPEQHAPVTSLTPQSEGKISAVYTSVRSCLGNSIGKAFSNEPLNITVLSLLWQAHLQAESPVQYHINILFLPSNIFAWHFVALRIMQIHNYVWKSTEIPVISDWILLHVVR